MYVFKYLVVFFTCLWGQTQSAATPSNSTNVGGWNNAFSNGSTLIPLVDYGNKSYYFGVYFKATFLEAEQFCRDIHMELVRVQTAEENDNLYKYIQESTKETFYWSAGSKLLDKKNWIWMTTGEIVEYTNWAPGEPAYPNTELCLALSIRNKGLFWDDRECVVKFNFICEKDRRRPHVSSQDTDSRWPAVFQNPSVSPNINLINFEGKTYYFGTYFKATYLQATQFCRIIHMQLVSVTSEAENKRLHKYLRDTGVGDSFWSSGSKAIDGKNWVWLSTGDYVDYTNWKAGQPDNGGELCIQFEQNKENGLFWQDYACDTLFNFICESYDYYIPPSPQGSGQVILPGPTDTVGPGPNHCSSQPVVNVYVNNNQGSNKTTTESKKVTSCKGEGGCNVEVNNNIETCPESPYPTRTDYGYKKAKTHRHH